MKKILLFSAGFLVSAVIVCSAQNREKVQKESSLLWKISGKDLTRPSYLFGTIHMICLDQFLWTPAMKDALDKSQQVAFEMNLDDPSLAMEVSAGMMLPEGKELKDYFSPKDYARLEKYAEDTLQIPAMMLERMQPFAVLTVAAMKNSDCKKEAVSYEEKINGWAKGSHKQVVGLESAEDQLDIMKEMNKDSTAQQILQILNHPQQAEIQYRQLVSAYLHQNLDSLHQIILSSPDIKADLKTLLYNRNKKWIPEIEKYIRQETTFIAVGAGHLGGNDGVIQLLRQAGYTVEPVR